MTGPHMSRSRIVALRFGAVAIGILVATLMAEGAFSLITGRSALRRDSGASAPFRMRMLDEERLAAAALTEGAFAVAADPYVAMALKGNHSTRSFLDQVANTDAIGMRKRVPRGDVHEEGKRIVILGDSVAFGFGLEDHETFAQQTEDFLKPITRAGQPPPVGLTVACPGWSFQNCRRFLLDHLAEIRPDLVVYLPIPNDLDDSYTVLENGHQSLDLDPARGAEWPDCNLTFYQALRVWRRQLFPRAPEAGQVYALYSGVTPESHTRYGAMIDGLADLDARLHGRNCRFAIGLMSSGGFERRIAQYLSARHLVVPVLPIFEGTNDQDHLEGDPHPNARFVKAGAWRIAKFLIERQWVETNGLLPPEDPRYVGRGFSLPDAAALVAESSQFDRVAKAEILRRVDLTDGTGWHQIYGGIWPDGMIGLSGFAVVAAGGATKLAVRIARLPDRPGLHPLLVKVSANGIVLGAVAAPALVSGDDPILSVTYQIPSDLRDAEFLDIRLVPTNWVSEKIEGVTRLAACKLVSLAAE